MNNRVISYSSYSLCESAKEVLASDNATARMVMLPFPTDASLREWLAPRNGQLDVPLSTGPTTTGMHAHVYEVSTDKESWPLMTVAPSTNGDSPLPVVTVEPVNQIFSFAIHNGDKISGINGSLLDSTSPHAAWDAFMTLFHTQTENMSMTLIRELVITFPSFPDLMSYIALSSKASILTVAFFSHRGHGHVGFGMIVIGAS